MSLWHQQRVFFFLLFFSNPLSLSSSSIASYLSFFFFLSKLFFYLLFCDSQCHRHLSFLFRFLYSNFHQTKKKTHTLKFMNPKLIWLWGLLLKQGWTRSRSERRGQRCRGQIIYTTSQERPPSGVSRAPLKQTNQTRRIRAKKKCSKKTETCNVSSLFWKRLFFGLLFLFSLFRFRFFFSIDCQQAKINETKLNLIYD